MKKSESIVKISVALLKAQKNIKSVTKDASNPFFKSKYADLASVINACKEELNAEGITFLQPVDEMFVNTILLHESGEYLSSLTPIVCKSANNPQDLGSAITYARRYALQSFIGLPAVDDDGERATDHNVSQPNAPKTASTPLNRVRYCDKHDVDVEVKIAKTGKPYAMHMVDGVSCFVNSEEEKDGFREKQEDYGMDNMMGAESKEPKLEEPPF